MAGAEFSDAAVPRELLRRRAYNLRWAQQPDDVIPLTAADSDFPVSPAVRERLTQFVADGLFNYGPPEGLPEFRATLAQWYTERRGVPYEPTAVLATDSAAAAMTVVARASLAPGDEVLIPDPVDFLFEHAIRRAGAIPVRVPLAPKTTATDYVAALGARLTSRTRMVWLCNPHNPWGTVPTRRWLQAVARWAVRHRLRLLSDEVWADITYPPHRCTSVAALAPEIAAQTVTIYGFSKNFALAGLRVGAVLCTDPTWREEIVTAADVRSTAAGVSVLSQVAAVAAMQAGEPWLAEFLSHLRKQRDLVLGRLRRWPGVATRPPQGTFVAFPDLSRLDPDAEHLCQHFEHKAKVALVPGSPRWFGPGAAGHVRISFATSREILTEAFDRLDPVVFELASGR
ncbi:pyridoxal phosphate-dependent aminotransferase [Natronosporangium hydrolyticum]|uniref:Aminotransferase n=1 Tax=Natronosporangium hydrolyticum TaxID=2811111 RepID=A0A895YJE4_9ACTN|nr:pyridoxal phosphate-dependent aminotransferase [Natronosporangium hydrolyticum]QSB15483.1 pyridoxal phosphate-dependent aminotransferase [Natronosporangium hydrolyticum]